MEIETRMVNLADVEVNSAVEDSPFIGEVAGYAVVFDKPSLVIPNGGFIEYIKPQALNGVDLSNVLALYNHDYGNVLGRTGSNTLQLYIDDMGLYFKLKIPNTTIGNDVYTNIKAGNLQGMSFGFQLGDQGSTMTKKGGQLYRTIFNIQSLNEISIVPFPAYNDTELQITRSAQQQMNKINQDDVYLAKVRAVLSYEPK